MAAAARRATAASPRRGERPTAAAPAATSGRGGGAAASGVESGRRRRLLRRPRAEGAERRPRAWRAAGSGGLPRSGGAIPSDGATPSGAEEAGGSGGRVGAEEAGGEAKRGRQRRRRRDRADDGAEATPGGAAAIQFGGVGWADGVVGGDDAWESAEPTAAGGEGSHAGVGDGGGVGDGARNPSDRGEMCAMKEVTLFSDDPKSKESARQLGQEISLLSRLQHPNIVRYYGSETVDDKLYIYLEYVSGGSIHKLLQEYGQFGEPAIRSYTKQILLGLAYLHAKNTVHRDIKGANILVDPNGRVKLADFGMAKHINGQQCPLSFKGSPYWMAPEVIKHSNGCNLAVDIWSLGCTVLEMATSKPPWSQYEGIAAVFKIGNGKELPPIPDHLSEDGKNFIRQCLQRDPSSRPTAVDLLQHSFVRNASPLEKSVASDPLEQLAAISCKPNSKVVGHVRNMSSLGLDGQSIYQRRAAKFSSTHSDIHIRSNISCPVSPCGSPLLRSRSPQHQHGRMSPSPISSPRSTSGASTPLTGGSGAIPFNHMRQPAYSNEGFTIISRGLDEHLPSRPPDPVLGRFVRVQHPSPGHQERVSEADILSPQFGKMGHGNVWDLHDRSLPSEHTSQHGFGDHVKLKPSLDLTSGTQHLGRNHGY